MSLATFVTAFCLNLSHHLINGYHKYIFRCMVLNTCNTGYLFCWVWSRNDKTYDDFFLTFTNERRPRFRFRALFVSQAGPLSRTIDVPLAFSHEIIDSLWRDSIQQWWEANDSKSIALNTWPRTTIGYMWFNKKISESIFDTSS